MIEITGSYKEIKIFLPETTIGTCNYSARIFDFTGEILHEAKAINGIKLQWITSTISLVTVTEDAITKIAELYPAPATPEALPEPPQPVGW